MEIVASAADAAFVPWNEVHALAPARDVLVTGGAGKLGSAIVDALVANGRSVRVLARRAPRRAVAAQIEYVVGDLGDPDVVDRAVRGVRSIVHAGAAMGGDWNKFLGGTIVGTRNVLESMRRHGVRRLVHVSSLSVVDWAGNDQSHPVDERTAYEPRPDERGYYTQSKLEAERLVRAAAEAGQIDAVILRPGQIFGRSQPVLTAAVSRRVGGLNLVLGDGALRLPLVHVDDVVAAVLLSLEASVPSGTVLQVVDPGRFTQNDVLRVCRPPGLIVRLPRPVVFALGWLSEKLLGALGRQSPFAVYRLRSALARLEFDSTAARDALGWRPIVGAASGLEREAESARRGAS
jgi:nucleoside-diphosphate-sugar epimerase